LPREQDAWHPPLFRVVCGDCRAELQVWVGPEPIEADPLTAAILAGFPND
jgi:hypothetical protein